MSWHSAGPVPAQGGERDRDLAALVGVGLDLPVGADVPAEYKPVRGLVGEHTRPLAFAPVDATVVDASALARLENRLGYVDGEHVVLARLDVVEVRCEDRERTLDRHVDDDLRTDERVLCLRAHETSSFRCLATAL